MDVTDAVKALITNRQRCQRGRSCHHPLRSPASLRAIRRAELSFGALPPSYRSFLQLTDGFADAFLGLGLFGCAELTVAGRAGLPRGLGALDPGVASGAYRVFGSHGRQAAVAAFDLRTITHPDEEPEVVLWMGDVGERFDGFVDLLGFLADLWAAETARPQIAHAA